jgi:hypothetical protein
MKKAAEEHNAKGRTVDRKHPCPECGKPFANQQVLRIHRAYKHPTDGAPAPKVGESAPSSSPAPAKKDPESWGFL